MAAPELPELEVSLPDNTRRRVASGTPIAEVLQAWNREEYPRYLAATWEGAPVDLSRRLIRSGRLAPLSFEDRAGREVLQHSAAHLVAKAVMDVVPSALPTDGPPTEEGFHYDFVVRPLAPDDLKFAEAQIRKDIAADMPFVREEVSRDIARSLFASNPYKLQYIENAPASDPISVYRTGPWLDLCRGPHVPSTRWLDGLQILGFSAVGAPETGASSATQQRVRGVAFPTRSELETYLARRAEAAARDHRVYGQRMELFLFHEGIPGFPFWLPKGMVIVRELERFVREHLERAGYDEVRTPLLFPQTVYETSGHWSHYRENMFLTELEGRSYGWKPMNCPGSMLIFGSRPRSYRELPLRLAEFAPLHRLEASGTLHGLTRVRELVQDDAHIFVTEEQILGELAVLLDWVREAFETFRLSWTYELSTRSAQMLGDTGLWDRAEATLADALQAAKVPYRVAPGEGAFYAPKIDVICKDSLGRSWQTGTIQLDFQMPRRFGLQYQAPDGSLRTPTVIHRTILGTWERFVGVLLEHCAGRLPPWLAPVQARVLPVTDRHDTYAAQLAKRFKEAGLRAELVPPTETLSKRVRNAELDRVPYVIVAGDAEIQSHAAALRIRGEKGQRNLPVEDLLRLMTERIRAREYDP